MREAVSSDVTGDGVARTVALRRSAGRVHAARAANAARCRQEPAA